MKTPSPVVSIMRFVPGRDILRAAGAICFTSIPLLMLQASALAQGVVSPCSSDVQLPAAITVNSGLSTYYAGSNLSAGGSFLVNTSPTDTGSVTFEAGAAICIGPGFDVKAGAATTAFHAVINSLIVPLSVTTSSLPAGTLGSSYSQTLAATGGTSPYGTWTVVSGGALPPGLSLNTATGVISGTPSSATGSPFNFSVTVMDAVGGMSPPRSLSIAIGPVTITTASPLPAGTAGLAYSTTLAASGGKPPYSNWTVASGALPSGLTLNASTGAISGTPSSGADPFTVTVQDSNGLTSAARTFSIAVAPHVTVSTSSSVTVPLGQGYPITLTVTPIGGYTGTGTITPIGPPGVSVLPNPLNVTLSGAPITVNAVVTAGAGATSGTLHIADAPVAVTVQSEPAPVISLDTPASSTVWGVVDFGGFALNDTPYLNDPISGVTFSAVKTDDTGLSWTGQATYGDAQKPRYDVCGGDGNAGTHPGAPGCPNVQFDYLWNSGQTPGGGASFIPNGAYDITLTASGSSTPTLTNSATTTVTVDNQLPISLIASPINSGDPSGTTRTFSIVNTSPHTNLDIGYGQVLFHGPHNDCLLQWGLDNSIALTEGTTNLSGTLGQTGSLAATDCTLLLSGSSLSIGTNSVTVNLAMSFSANMNGLVQVQAFATNAIGQEPPMSTLTSYTVSPGTLTTSPELLVLGPQIVKIGSIGNTGTYPITGVALNSGVSSPTSGLCLFDSDNAYVCDSTLGPSSVSANSAFTGAGYIYTYSGLTHSGVGEVYPAVTATLPGGGTISIPSSGASGVITFMAMGSSAYFSVDPSLAINSVAQGGAWSFTEKLMPINGYSGYVSFTQTDTTGITLTPPSATYVSGSQASPQLTAHVPASQPPGLYELRLYVTDTAGNQEYTQIYVNVTSGSAPDFVVGPITNESVSAGNSVNFTMQIAPVNGYTGTVTPSSTGLPADYIGLTFSPASLTFSGSTPQQVTGTLTTTSQTPATSFDVPLTAQSGAISHNSTVHIAVQGGPDPGFILANPSVPTVPLGSSKTVMVTVSTFSAFSGTVNLSTSGVPSGISVQLNPSSLTFNSSTYQLSAPLTINGLTQGAFTFNLSAASSGHATQTVSVSVTVGAPIPLSVSGWTVGPNAFDSALCPPSGATYVFGATAAGGVQPYTFTWTGATSGQTGARNYICFTPTPGTYYETVTLTDSNSDTAAQTIIPLYVPVDLSVDISASAPQVVNQPITFTAVPAGGLAPYTYLWSPPLSGTAATASFTPAAAGPVYATVRVWDHLGSFQDKTLLVNVAPALSVDLTASPSPASVGQTIVYTATASGGAPGPTGYSYSWSQPATPAGSSATYTPTAAGTTSETVTVSDSTGTSVVKTATVTVNASSGVVASVSALPLSPIVNQSSTLTGSATGGTPPYSYSWAVTSGSGTITGSGDTVQFSSTTAGTNVITLTVTDSGSPVLTGYKTATIVVQSNTNLTINPQSLSAHCGGVASGTIGISGIDSWSASTSAGADWITLAPPLSGTGAGSLAYSVSMNIGPPRSGNITIGSQTFTVAQDGGTAAPNEYIRIGSRTIARESGCVAISQ